VLLESDSPRGRERFRGGRDQRIDDRKQLGKWGRQRKRKGLDRLGRRQRLRLVGRVANWFGGSLGQQRGGWFRRRLR
jgi:hypothetical protein